MDAKDRARPPIELHWLLHMLTAFLHVPFINISIASVLMQIVAIVGDVSIFFEGVCDLGVNLGVPGRLLRKRRGGEGRGEGSRVQGSGVQGGSNLKILELKNKKM